MAELTIRIRQVPIKADYERGSCSTRWLLHPDPGDEIRDMVIGYIHCLIGAFKFDPSLRYDVVVTLGRGGSMTPVEVMRYMNQTISAAEKLTDSIKVIELLTRLRDAEVVRLVELEARVTKSNPRLDRDDDYYDDH